MRVRQAVITLAGALAVLAGTNAALAQTSGDARIAGKVVDEQKKPVPDVAVRAHLAGQMPPREAKTNNKGEWSINNIAGGMWEIEFRKDGFAPQRITLELKPDQRIPNIDVVLALPAADPTAVLQEEWKRGATLMQGGKSAEARAVFEELVKKYPSVAQLHDGIARTFAFEGQVDKAIEQSRLAVEKDPQNSQFKALLGDLLIEKGEKPEAEKILDSIDLATIEDPGTFINLLIIRINDKRTDEALALAEKLIVRFPKEASLYYYRARAHLAGNKLPEAKADLEKFVALALPDARELPDARKLLEQLKDAK